MPNARRAIHNGPNRIHFLIGNQSNVLAVIEDSVDPGCRYNLRPAI